MSLLVCTLGSSDINGEALRALRTLSERERAQHLLDNWPAGGLELPIINKALRYVQRQAETLTGVILVASDQGSAPPADPQARVDWGKDTCVVAAVIARALTMPIGDWCPIPMEQIAIWTMVDERGNGCDPSDYDAVRRFFERRLPVLHAAHPDDIVYLAVTGGTPAMTTGLLIAGTEVFGARAEALYIHPRRALPSTLNTGRRLQARPLRAALRSNIATYDYDAALRLLRAERAVIGDRLVSDAIDVLEALLDYSRCRFNFDLPGALRALDRGVDRSGDGRWRTELMEFSQAVFQPTHATLLAEVYYGAAARYAVGAFPDFLTQVVRFQESSLRLLCLERGAVFIDRDGNVAPGGHRLDPSWVALHGFPERASQGLNRGNLRWLLITLAKRNGEEISDILVALDRLEGLVKLRNDLTHTFAGVDQRDLARVFAGADAVASRADAIVPYLAQIYTLVTNAPLQGSPFDAINHFLATLLHEADPA